MMSRSNASELMSSLAEDRAAIAQALVTRRLHPLLALDLSIQQLRFVLLVASGEASTGREIARQLNLSAPTVSIMVERLVESGFISRDDSTLDRRVKRLSVTEAGRAVYDDFLGLRDEAHEFLTELSADELVALADGTAALRRAVERHVHRDGLA